jgi:hypothetical protein
MLAATDGLPINFGFTGKGNDAGPEALEDTPAVTSGLPDLPMPAINPLSPGPCPPGSFFL